MSEDAPVSTAALREEIISRLYLAEQIDRLHLSLVRLLEVAGGGDLDLVLDQSGKSTKQKVLFLQKYVDEVDCPELKQALQEVLNRGELDFFEKKNFPDFLHKLQEDAEAVAIVKLAVATRFKEKDLQAMSELAAKRIGHPAALELRVDHTLIGGAVIRFGSYISDYSLKTRLEQFRSHWRKAVVEE